MTVITKQFRDPMGALAAIEEAINEARTGAALVEPEQIVLARTTSTSWIDEKTGEHVYSVDCHFEVRAVA